MDKSKKVAKSAAGKSTDRKPRSVSKSDNKRKSSKSQSKSKGRQAKSVAHAKSQDAKASKKGKKDQPKESKAKSRNFKLTLILLSEKKKKEEEEEEYQGAHPTRALSAYIFFSNEMIPKLKKEEGVPHKDAMSRAGEEWRKIDAKAKEKYDKMHDEDVKRYVYILLISFPASLALILNPLALFRYEKQLQEIKDKGYFIMEDGKKSNEVEVTGKKKRGQRSEKKSAKKRSSAVSASKSKSDQKKKEQKKD